MSIPRFRFPLFFRRLCAAGAALVLAAVLGAAGCNRNANTHITPTQNLEGGAATFDARGGFVDNEVYLHQRLVTDGISGNGGSVRITSAAGDVNMVSTPQTFDVVGRIANLRLDQDPLSLHVVSGESRAISGGLVVDSLHVEPDGQLILLDSAFIFVNGDVLIAGVVRSIARTGVIHRDGHDFTLTTAATLKPDATTARGDVIITGRVITSGQNAAADNAAHSNPPFSDPTANTELAGKGGDIFMSTAGDLVITGEVLSDGGGSDAQDPVRGSAGGGGQVLLGTNARLFCAGRVSARAGNSFTNNLSIGPAGGSIQLVSAGDVLIENAHSVNVSGGRCAGVAPGAGGTVIIEAPTGNLTVSGISMDSSGGRAFARTSATGGVGGKVALTGNELVLGNGMIDARGGSILDTADGDGGAGGKVTLSGNTGITVLPDVAIDQMGGDSLGAGKVPGDGGTFEAVLSSGLAAVVFTGSLNVRGGNNFSGNEGKPGTACVSFPASATSLAKVIGINQYPVGACSASVFNDIPTVVHDLDCNGLVMPKSFTTTLPAVLGVDFYRVFVGGSRGVTVSTTGTTGGNIQLFVGNGAALKSTNPASYAFSSTNPDSSESVTVDDTTAPNLATLSAGGFISVLVAEGNSSVEEYTITITCSD